MNPKLIAASVAALLVAAGLFFYLGAGLEPADTIEPTAAEAGFAGQERREVEPWMPAPGMGTLADASIEALHEISVGASPSEALQKASSSRSLSMWGENPFLKEEAVENCEMTYFAIFDSFVNACLPFDGFGAQPAATTALPVVPAGWPSTWQLAVSGWIYEAGPLGAFAGAAGPGYGMSTSVGGLVGPTPLGTFSGVIDYVHGGALVVGLQPDDPGMPGLVVGAETPFWTPSPTSTFWHPGDRGAAAVGGSGGDAGAYTVFSTGDVVWLSGDRMRVDGVPVPQP